MKATILLALAASAFAASAGTHDTLLRHFRDPPTGSRPETWFHLIGGNVSTNGITADLEAIKSSGFAGVQLFHGRGAAWPGARPQIQCLGPLWNAAIGHAAAECKRLGLRFTMQNCPGWSMAGGPWIKPSNAMRRLVWSKSRVAGGGGTAARLKLPHPCGRPARWQDYREIAVLAFPAPSGDGVPPVEPVSATCNLRADMTRWLKNPLTVSIPGYSTGRPTWSPGNKEWTPIPVPAGTVATVNYKSAAPATVRTIEFQPVKSLNHLWAYLPETHVTVEANGKTLADFDVPPSHYADNSPLSIAIDETRADEFTVRVISKHDIFLNRVRFFATARPDNFEAQAGWTLRGFLRRPVPRQGPDSTVQVSAVRDISAFMKPDGTLEWKAPPGRWTVLRIGHANTGKRNGPAPREATGWECDKFSPSGADANFNGYIGRVCGENGPAHGLLKGVLMDSWECGVQSWTAGCDRMFRERFGYDLLPFLPALAGYVAGSHETTARFLADWRRFTSGLVTENFYGRMARRCHENGLELTFETAMGDVLAGDILEYFKYADVPMCEFWHPQRECGTGSRDFKPVKPCVSAAHLYGKRRVAAEAFTSFDLTWDESPRDLKHTASLHLAEEVSHLVFHTYTHNPLPDAPPPGSSFGGSIGTPFMRKQTWWRAMPEFTGWLARCQTMLEAGRSVRDVLWYLGDECGHKPAQYAPFPEGFRYDYCNPDALMHRLSVNANGDWETPDGAKYRVLWIPECRRMLPETMERIAECAEKGAVIAFAALPEAPATLAGGAATERRFAAALKKMENLAAQNRKFHVGKDLSAVLSSAGVAPDLTGGEGRIVWNHRTCGTADWYFVAPSRAGEGFGGTVSLRCAGRVEIWHPETGETHPAPSARRTAAGRTEVELDLAPSETVFIFIDSESVRL